MTSPATPVRASARWPCAWATAAPGPLYVGLLLAAFVSVPFVAGLGARPLGGLAMITVIVAHKPVTMVLSGARGPQLIPVLGGTARLHLLFGLILALGIGVSGALGT